MPKIRVVPLAFVLLACLTGCDSTDTTFAEADARPYDEQPARCGGGITVLSAVQGQLVRVRIDSFHPNAVPGFNKLEWLPDGFPYWRDSQFNNLAPGSIVTFPYVWGKAPSLVVRYRLSSRCYGDLPDEEPAYSFIALSTPVGAQ